MTLSEYLTRLNYTLRGVDEDAPTFGEDEANYWVDTLNRIKDDLYNDTTKNWANIYDVLASGTITASTAPVYDLDDTFLKLAGDEATTNGSGGGVYIIKTDGNRIDIDVVDPNERNPYVRAAFIAGFDPQQLFITDEIVATENIIGGTLYVPGYYMPEDLSGEQDVLPFLNPNWAVMAAASEIAFNDITYEDKAPDLNAKANDLFEKMVKRNASHFHNSPKRIKTNVRRISGVGDQSG